MGRKTVLRRRRRAASDKEVYITMRRNYALLNGFPHMFRDVDHVLRQLSSGSCDSNLPAKSSATQWVPAVESFDREGDVVLRVELPGVSKDQLEIQVEGDQLTIRGEKKDERSSEEGAKLYFRELSYGSFERTFRLPEDLRRDAIKASFRDGVLELTLPLQKPESRKISIEGGEPKAA